MDSLTILTYVFSCCSVAKLYMTLCDPMDYSTLGFPVLHQLPEFPQIHVHWVNAAIEPTHPLPTSSPFASIFHSIRVFSRGFWLFKSGGQSIGDSASASDLPMNIQGWFPLGLTGLFSLQFMGLSRVFSSTIVQKHQFFSALPSLLSNSHICTWLLERPQTWLYTALSTKWCLCFLIQCLGLFSRRSSWPRNQTQVSCIARRFFTIWATREALWSLGRECRYSQCIAWLGS